METTNKLKDVIIEEYNSHSLLTSCLYIEKYNIVACGDNNGRILIFDQRVEKPFVQLIISDSKSEISNLQYLENNNELFFSSNDKIYSIENITNNYVKKILSKDKIKTNIINENEDGEITDFLVLPDNTIIYPEQEEETFKFYKINNNYNSNDNLINNNKEESNSKSDSNSNENSINEESNLSLPYKEFDKFFLSSAYGEEYLPSLKKVLLYSFDGEIFLYDYKLKNTDISIQIKDTFEGTNIDKGNLISNPPYLNKVIVNKDNNEIYCGMMNGVIVSLKSSNLKRNKIKTVHNGSINDIKMSKFKMNSNKREIISFGMDKCLKFIDPINNLNIDYYADLNCNLIDFDSDKDGNIFYIDDCSKMLYIMKFKN